MLMLSILSGLRFGFVFWRLFSTRRPAF